MAHLNLNFGNYECAMRVDEAMPEKAMHYGSKRHCNVEYELFIVLNGSITMNVEDHEYQLESGDALLIAPTKFHCSVETSGDLVNMIVPFMMHDSTASKDFFRQITPCRKLHMNDFTMSVCNSLMDELRDKPVFWQEAVQAKCSLIMSNLLRLLSDTTREEDTQQVLGPEQRFAAIDSFFEEYSGKYGTEQILADRLHISRRQLNRILMTHYGMSFRQKLLHSRMDRAAWLLRTTDLPVGEISEAVGYVSETSFYKAFKGYHKTTPQLYRKGFK